MQTMPGRVETSALPSARSVYCSAGRHDLKLGVSGTHLGRNLRYAACSGVGGQPEIALPAGRDRKSYDWLADARLALGELVGDLRV